MILADTSVWVDHFRFFNPDFDAMLQNGSIAIHPFVIAEIALGSLHDRRKTLAQLDELAQINVAHLGEVRLLVETHALYSRGIGLIDVHLVASCLITPGTGLWTRDVALQRIANALGVSANLP
jgi:hypothetical protein